eukprot:PhF_6_TR22698/c0_g1_i1/m.32324/K20027/ZDHHC1_11; palmitoyltransferase ZDHHC1/11
MTSSPESLVTPCVREWPCCNDADKLYSSNAWEAQPPRRHGFHRPFHFFQVTAITLFSSFFVLYWIFLAPFVRSPGHYVTHVVIHVLLFISFGSKIVCSTIDTRDWGLDHLAPEKGAHIFCFTCKMYVHRSSKHCKACNRCVHGFDHHCKWMNVCVGVKNYRSFITYVTSTLLAATSYIALSGYVLALCFTDNDYIQTQIDAERPLINVLGLEVALCVIIFLLLVAFGLLAHLFGFHVMLTCRGLTTYDWILEQRELERVREEAMQARQMGSAGGDGAPSGNSTLEDHDQQQQHQQHNERGGAEQEMTNMESLPTSTSNAYEQRQQQGGVGSKIHPETKANDGVQLQASNGSQQSQSSPKGNANNSNVSPSPDRSGAVDSTNQHATPLPNAVHN